MVQTKKQRRPIKNKKRTRSKKSHKGGSSNADFMKAINKADLEYIQSNIKQLEDLSFEDASGKTPLGIAVDRYNDLETTEFMGNYERKLELYSIRTQIIEILLENGANGGNIEIPGINLNKAYLKGVNLVEANLEGANLEDSNLEGANLEGANLKGVNLKRAILEGANLKGANLKGADLERANLVGANLVEADLEGAAMDGAIFEESNLEEEIFNTQSPSNVFHVLHNTERNERLKRERNEKKQKYLQREKTTINKSDINPFPTVGMTGHDVIMMEDVKYCDYIKEDPNNLLFIFDKQVAMINRSQIQGFIANETLDESKIVYQCKQTDMAFIARQENIISGPTLNMDIIGLFGVMIPLEYLDEVVNQPHQIFIVETNNNRSKNPIASLNTRLATEDESGQAVVSANHCQVEVSIKLGQLSYIENNVLEKECAKSGGKKRISRRKKGEKGGKLKGSRKNK